MKHKAHSAKNKPLEIILLTVDFDFTHDLKILLDYYYTLCDNNNYLLQSEFRLQTND